MSTANSEHGASATAVPPRWIPVASWLILLAIATLALARNNVWIQEAGFSSVLLPIVVGGIVGALTVGIARLTGQCVHRAMLIAAIVFALMCVVAEHLLFYVDYRAQFFASAAKNPAAQIFQTAGGLQPASFPEFLRAGAQRSFGVVPAWLWWIIDAALTIVAGAAVVMIFHRGPQFEATARPQAGSV